MNLFVSRDLIALLKPLKPKVENSPQLRLAL
jgi:hypothetical protein